MLRIIVIISMWIVWVFFLRQCTTSDINIFTSRQESEYNTLLDEALARNFLPVSNPQTWRQVYFSMEEMFGTNSHIYLSNKEQIELKRELQTHFEDSVFWNKELLSLEKSDAQIESQLERERRIQSPSYRVSGNNYTDSQSDNYWWYGECAWLIFDPCIVLGEDIPPPGIMDFWTWRWKSSL